MSDQKNAAGGESPVKPAEAAAEPDQFITKELLDEKLNSAITGHLKRFSRSLDTSLSKRDKELSQKLADLMAPKEPEESAEGEGERAVPLKEGSNEEVVTRAVAEAERRFKRLRQKDQERIAALEHAAKDKEQALLRERRSNSLREALESHGVSSAYLKHAMAYVGDRVQYDEDQQLIFVTDEGDQVPLREGVAEWARTEDAKLYLPARGLSGSGDRGRGVSAVSQQSTDLRAGILQSIKRGIR